MFTIRRHGVLRQANGLSPMQNRLAERDTAPALVIGAPTGAGKTFGFRRLVEDHRAVVVFIVPTQTLAQNILEDLSRAGLFVRVWDSAQTAVARAQGQCTWTVRKRDLRQAGQRGGMIVATLEAFHGITLGRTDRAGVNLVAAHILDLADFLVFDEAHLLNERAFGFVALWATLIAHRRLRCRGRTRMALLSATHSNLPDLFVTTDSAVGLPVEWVERCDESITDLDPGSDDPAVRIIHGEVTLQVHQGRIEDHIQFLLPTLLVHHTRVLVVYDSLARLALQEHRLRREVCVVAGLSPDEVHIATSQDKYLERSAGSGGFHAGREIPDHCRLIVGTSAVEVGLNLPQVTALVTDPGFNAGALLQRIGRIARGDLPGEVHLVADTCPPYVIKLAQLSGHLGILELSKALAPLVNLNSRRAHLLGGAYLSMLRRANRNLRMGLDRVLDVIVAEQGHEALQRRSLLNAARAEVRRLAEREPFFPYLKQLQNWLNAIDRQLEDLRGFAPTVMVRFADTPAIPCPLPFVQKWLPLPDDPEGEVLVFKGPRDAYIKERPDPIDVEVLTPFGRVLLQRVHSEDHLREEYKKHVCRHHDEAIHPELKSVVKFARSSGLVPVLSPKVVNAAKDGSYLF